MSLLKSIGRVIGGFATGGIAGGIATAAGGLLKGTVKAAPKVMKAGLPALPGVGGGGSIIPPLMRGAKAAFPYAAAAGIGMLFDADGNPVKVKKRRRKGITARDLMSFKRVARLVDKFSKPVHHFRNFKKGQ